MAFAVSDSDPDDRTVAWVAGLLLRLLRRPEGLEHVGVGLDNNGQI